MGKDNLNKKLAEWAGFKYGRFDFVSSLSSELNFIDTGWLSPVAIKEPYSSKDFSRELPDFTNSLDACFRWLVPKLTFRSFTLERIGGEWECEAHPDGETMTAKIPALALCLVISRLIDGEK